MPHQTHHDRYTIDLSELITEILSHLPQNADALTRDFVRHYYSKMPVLELMRLEAKEACQIALASLPFFRSKKERVQVRSFAPTKDEYGWEGHYLAVEVHNDDHAFILDSLRAEFIRQGFDFVNIIHPIFFLRRDKNGELIELVEIDESGDLPRGAKAESFIHFQLAGIPSSIDQEKLHTDLLRVLHAVELVVDDFTTLDKKCDEAIREVVKLRAHFDEDEVEEVKAFLEWLRNKHYVFLGYMEYDFTDRNDAGLRVVEGSQLGIFKLEDEQMRPKALGSIPGQLLDDEKTSELIEITKSNRRSIVHRPVLMDYIAIKRFDGKGRLIGERRFLGMFTSMVYYQSAERIPFIRRKINQTLSRANYDPMSHNGKALKAILEFYPRDELFQISLQQLFDFSLTLMTLEAKPEVRLLARLDRYERFVSCMAFIPRDRFSSYLREQIIAILEKHYAGKMRDFYTQLTDSPLARLHLIIETTPGEVPQNDIAEAEAQIARITNRWADSLRSALQERYGVDRSEALLPVYADAFPGAYIEQQDASHAAADIEKIEDCIEAGGLAIDLFRRNKGDSDHYHLKIYTYQSERALSDMLPILEHFGCWIKEVRPYSIKPRWQHGDILIRDFHLHIEHEDGDILGERKARFEQALREVWQYRISNDAFNALVLAAGLNVREVEVLRTYAHYLRQVGFSYSNQYIAEALSKHPLACQSLIRAFMAKFDPGKNDHAAHAKQELEAIDAYLSGVSNSAEDRIIRRFADLIHATLRTNFFQKTAQGEAKPYLSLKFRSALVPDLPKPVPYAEIFVYSMRSEGIHLRGDAVARGGLRWSDRPEDFRTEVLGLVKAQMVKNAVIVPQGAKGGFVLKQPPADGSREALMEEGIACYKQFLCGLLDITDNLKQGDVLPPVDVVRHDGDDPYLVVAADKGTATFSDIANGVAASYDFWLGDAFASGGSAGYDHKEMGITARGAWVSVERHFMEMGKDIRRNPFTCVGIGDMSGDVFGNGMLLSDKTLLLAAFNHKHIFIDPAPDAAKSFAERKRLFELPRSQWSDYNEKLISKGGGIYARDAKSITISKQAAEALGCSAGDITPDELIRTILKSPAELLWNGGIGTYVKASEEAHSQVGDHANTPVRVNGNELRCLVVGEGGNLGFTQRGRIEYAMQGGRINTDAIDNSAGVDCSDHEVNIKIALSDAVATGKLNTDKRNSLLEGMTESVANLVLIDNRLQTQAITITQFAASAQLEPLARMMRHFEQQGFLDRGVEFLPTDKQISERRAQGASLTRPELAVLLSYAKLSLYGDIKDSAMVKDDYFIDDLLRYFPPEMRESYRSEILAHRLRPAIVATMLSNSMINRAGITFAHRIGEETGVHPCDIARAYTLTRDAFMLRDVWSEIEKLGNQIDAKTQADLFMAVQHFVENMTRWFLSNCSEPIHIIQTMQDYASGIARFAECYPELMSKTLRKAYETQTQNFMNKAVPESLAAKIAGLEVMASACDVVKVANSTGVDVANVGKIYFELGAQLRLGWLRRSANKLLSEGYWEQQAIHSIIREMYVQQRRLTTHIMQDFCDGSDAKGICEKWYETHHRTLKRYHHFTKDLKAQESVDLPMLVVALRKIEEIAPH